MQIWVKAGNKTLTVDVEPCNDIGSLKQKIYRIAGIKPDDQRIIFKGRQLQERTTFLEENIGKESNLFLVNRLRGGGGGGSITFNIKPRIQKETWSLYWKESMNTDTMCLDPFTVEMDSSIPVSEYQTEVAKKMGWRPISELLRLEGFSEPWERSIYKGRELPTGSTLEECGVEDGATITTVRKALVAEGIAFFMDNMEVLKQMITQQIPSTCNQEENVQNVA